MRKLLAVTIRELRERWLLFPGALALGFVPLGFVPLMLPAGIDRDASPTVGLFMAVAMGVAAAILGGSSVFARDAIDGRLAFLFARPVSWPSIWAGKWVAAIVLVAASGWLAAIPWMVAYPPQRGGSWLKLVLDAEGATLFFVWILLAIGLASLNATAIRSRSPWLAIDLVLLLVAVWAFEHVAPVAGILIGSFSGRGGTAHFGYAYAVLLLPLVVALVAGSVSQLAFGRTDIRRAHRALSLAFWAVIMTTLIASGCWLAWAEAAPPSALTGLYSAVPSPDGRWIYVEGSSRRGGWYGPSYLIDAETGSYLSSPPPAPRLFRRGSTALPELSFSADGRTALRWISASGSMKLTLIDLQTSPPRQLSLPAQAGRAWARPSVALSPSATAMFLAQANASLLALPSGDLLSVHPLPRGCRVAALRYLREDSVRAWLVLEDPTISVQSRMWVLELTRGTKPSLTAVPTAPATSDSAREGSPGRLDIAVDAPGRRFLTFEGGLRLRDAEKGTLLATLAEGRNVVDAGFLADGRIVALELDRLRAAVLSVFAADGTALRQIPLGESLPRPLLGPEPAPGRVTVVLQRSVPRVRPRPTWLSVPVDGTPAPEPLADAGALPISAWRGPWRADVSPRAPLGAPLFYWDGERGLVHLDTATGRRRVVAGAGAPAGRRLGAF